MFHYLTLIVIKIIWCIYFLTFKIQHLPLTGSLFFVINLVKYEAWTGVLMSKFHFPVQQIVLLLLKFLAPDNCDQYLPAWVGNTKLWSHTAHHFLVEQWSASVYVLLLLLLETVTWLESVYLWEEVCSVVFLGWIFFFFNICNQFPHL